ncbi:hypothetical protein HFO99_30460 [Rhizobium leguminosarum]|uniref:hypothetical protein n=1 Tax=Rhizobium leguminosarum TaxID=384 RepID=UPI001C94A8BA|nr:hypothetical protein [Rhizobium leguminosarum]MBY5338179.1 hypothetical protein [Rhizobium leguminosarum]
MLIAFFSATAIVAFQYSRYPSLPFHRFVVVCLALLVVTPALAVAEDRRSFGINEPLPGEDPTCNEANRAFENTYNSGRYSSRIYLADSHVSLFSERRYNGRTLYERKEDGGLWSLLSRGVTKTVTDVGPVLTDCNLISYEKYRNTNVGTFSGRWHRGPYHASIMIWLSATDRLLLKTERIFDPDKNPFSARTVMDIYETNRDNVAVPNGFFIDNPWIR